MTYSAWALQKGAYERLAADTGLTTLLGGPRIYDDVPRKAPFPYLTLGPVSTADWSTGTEAGGVHDLVVHIWSRSDGKRETLAIIEAVGDALHEAALTLDGHHLVNLRFEFADARRDPDGFTYHGVVRFRAVTEPSA